MSEFQKKFAPGRLAEDLRCQPPPEPPPAPALPEAEELRSTATLGVDRNRKVRLELRFKDGRVKAINYADVVLMDYDPEEAITLDLPPHFRVRLKGIGMASLLTGLAAERVSYIREIDAFAASARQDTKPVVFAIALEKWKEWPLALGKTRCASSSRADKVRYPQEEQA